MASDFPVEAVASHIESRWPTLQETLRDFIRIPNQSPAFDADWASNGHMDRAVTLLRDWVLQQQVAGLTLDVVREPGRTPLLFVTVDATEAAMNNEVILMYGHLDKQPPLHDGWAEGLGPYDPVIVDGIKLYGRGGADDGYAIFSAIAAIKALQEQKLPHARIVIVIEACEESGSPDLPFYIEKLKDRIKIPSLIVCLDSGCGNYDTMWLTTSLRGVLVSELKVTVLKEGVHSGHASGIVPSSFRIIRQLLDRIEDPQTAEVKIPEFHAEIPAVDVERVHATAKALGDGVFEEFPYAGSSQPVHKNVAELLLNRTWRPVVSVVGADGIPSVSQGGNVLRASTTLKLSIRLPPTVHPDRAANALKAALTANPPFQAVVECNASNKAAGWAAPAMEPWLANAVDTASQRFFKNPPLFIGEGGSIPFMGMLHEMFPKAQFVITGILGPQSNAHGPNEFLHIPMMKKLTGAISSIVVAHFHQFVKLVKH